MKKSKFRLPENCCFVDYEKRFAIGYDSLQWIVKYGDVYNYYPTMRLLLLDGLEHAARGMVGNKVGKESTNRKTLIEAIHEAQEYIEYVAANIKLPN